MKRINKVKKELARQGEREQDALKRTYIARGKIEMLDEFWQALDIQQKRDIVKLEFPSQKWTDDELWLGFTLTEKAEVLINLIKSNA